MKALVLLAFVGSVALGQSEVTANNAVATSNGVTLSTTQTITGTKTFSALLNSVGLRFAADANTIAWLGGLTLESEGTGLKITGYLNVSDTTNGIASNVMRNYNGSTLNVQANATVNLKANDITQAIITTGGLTIGATGTAIATSYAGSAVIDFGSTTTTTANSSNITVAGAAVGDGCIVGVPVAAQVTGASFTCFVTAADTVVVRLTAIGATVDPASGTFTVRTFDP